MRRIALVALLLLALAGYLATGITLVRPGERAVVRRFGRVLKTKPAPGLFIGLPWGMDRVDRVPVHKVQQLEIGYRPGEAEATDRSGLNIPGQLVTGDHNLVNVRVAIDYAVDPDEDQIVNYVLHANRAEGLVARTAESALAEWVADRRIDDILIRGQAELPGWIVQEIQNRLNAYQIGVRIQGASVPLLQPPDEVQLAFTAVNDAQLSISTKERIASRVAAERLAEAEAEKYRLEQDSRAYAREQRLRAQADGDAFLKRLAQYRSSASRRGDFLVRMWWDEMGKLFTRMKQNGQLDLLDNHLGPDGLDITHTPALPRRK
jgi:membrane protease subunit HflK